MTRSKRNAWVRATIVVVLAVLLQELLVNLPLKAVCERPRMHDLTAPYEGFMPWYLPHSSALGGDSFPSGHTSRVAGSVFLLLLCDIDETYKAKHWLLLLFAVVWTCLIGLGQIVLVAHFAADLTTGAFVMLLSFVQIKALIDRLYERRSRKLQEAT